MAVPSPPRALVVVAFVLALPPSPAAGQTVRGTVVDELSGSPVAGAAVHLLSDGMEMLASAVTQVDGRFTVAVPEPGAAARYLVVEAQGFTRHLSDPLSRGSPVELGEVRLRPLGWAPTPVPALELEARTVAGWCAGRTDGTREGMLVGRVRDERTEEPLTGLALRLEWQASPGTARMVVGSDATLPRRRTVSGPGGLYHFCHVPAGRPVRVVAEVPAGSFAPVQTRVEASAVNRLDLTVPFSRPGQGAALFGRVVDGATGAPVAQARVFLTGERGWALTNDRGFFALEELPTGVQVLEVEHLAYRAQQHPVLLQPGTAGQVVVPLAVEAIPIDGLEVTVRSSWRLWGIRELERRRDLGLGTFFDQGEIHRRGIHYLGDVLRETPGTDARILGTGVSRRYVIRRVRRGGEFCVPAVFLNGRRYRLPGGLLELSASEMEVVEVHRAPGVPPEFVAVDGRAGACGVVSAWTRVGG